MVFNLTSGSEFLKSLEFPKWRQLLRYLLLCYWGDFGTTPKDGLLQTVTVHGVTKSQTWLSDWTELEDELLFPQSCLDSSRSHGPQHSRLSCLSPGACSKSCPLSRWCHPTISSSAAPFTSCLQSSPVSGSFLMSLEWAYQRTDTLELWCWRRLLGVPWTVMGSNQSLLKEINCEYSLEGLMLKLQYVGHLMRRADSLKKTLMGSVST